MAGIRNAIGNKMHAAWDFGHGLAVGAKNCVTNAAHAVGSVVTNTDLWTHRLQPIYDYRFKPIKKSEVLLVGTSAFVAAAVVKVAYSVLGKPILVMANLVGFCLIFAACARANERICQTYRDEMWDHLDELRQQIFNLSAKKRNITKSHDLIKTMFKNLQFKPLPDDVSRQLQAINGRFDKFTDQIYKPTYENYRNQISAAIDNLKTQVEGQAEILASLDQYKAEVNKVGTPQEDLVKLRQALTRIEGIENDAIKKISPNFREDYDTLNRALNTVNYEKTKLDLYKEIENLQLLLNKYRVPSPLKLHLEAEAPKVEPIKPEEAKAPAKKVEEPKVEDGKKRAADDKAPVLPPAKKAASVPPPAKRAAPDQDGMPKGKGAAAAVKKEGMIFEIDEEKAPDLEDIVVEI